MPLLEFTDNELALIRDALTRAIQDQSVIEANRGWHLESGYVGGWREILDKLGGRQPPRADREVDRLMREDCRESTRYLYGS